MRRLAAGSAGGLSLNCFPQLSRSLPADRPSTTTASAAPRGDAHSTILMRLLYLLAPLGPTGDLLRLYELKRDPLLALRRGDSHWRRSARPIELRASLETRDACRFLPHQPGTVTVLNLMAAARAFGWPRSSASGPDRLQYQGTPMRWRSNSVRAIVQGLVRARRRTSLNWAWRLVCRVCVSGPSCWGSLTHASVEAARAAQDHLWCWSARRRMALLWALGLVPWAARRRTGCAKAAIQGRGSA